MSNTNMNTNANLNSADLFEQKYKAEAEAMKNGEYWAAGKSIFTNDLVTELLKYLERIKNDKKILIKIFSAIYWQVFVAKDYKKKDIVISLLEGCKKIIKEIEYNIYSNEIDEFVDHTTAYDLFNNLINFYQDKDNIFNVTEDRNIYAYQPSKKEDVLKHLSENIDGQYIALNESIGDLNNFDESGIDSKIVELHTETNAILRYAEPLKCIRNIKKGDIIIYKDGSDTKSKIHKIYGYGIVKECYYHNETAQSDEFPYKHRCKVEWIKTEQIECNDKNRWMLIGHCEQFLYRVSLMPVYRYFVDKLGIKECQDCINQLKNNQIQEEKNMKEIKNWHKEKNLILYGPPGTGKTYNVANYAVAIIKNMRLEEVRQKDRQWVLDQYKQLTDEGRIQFVTFHQSYGYEEFIEGLRPCLVEKQDSAGTNSTGDVQYEIHPGIFKEFCDSIREKARMIPNDSVTSESSSDSSDTVDGNSALSAEPNKPVNQPADENNNYVFIIDEINRGNISKIFGELITLVEDSRREGEKEETSVLLPYSKNLFTIPNNLYIVGTMNTADRSITQIDAALRRRFAFREMMPDILKLRNIQVGKIKIDQMLEKINDRIDALLDRDHRIGHTYFLKLAENQDDSLSVLASIFKDKIIPLLQEYFFDDYEKIRLVLGDTGKNRPYQFITLKEKDKRNLFFGNANLDTEEIVIYEINESALTQPEAYCGIYEEFIPNSDTGDSSSTDSANDENSEN